MLLNGTIQPVIWRIDLFDHGYIGAFSSEKNFNLAPKTD